MNWRDDPATEKQISYLNQFNYVPDRPLTKGEASDLIEQFSEDPKRQEIRDEKQSARYEHELEDRERNLASYLHVEHEEAKQAVNSAERGDITDAKDYLHDKEEERLSFWRDTFQDHPEEMENASQKQAVKLYISNGYRLKKPSNKQIQKILDALDADSATWDRDTPEYFFQTLEFNFPELLRKNPDLEKLAILREVYSEWIES